MDSHIGEPDPPVQDRLLALFEYQLGYTYLGSYEYRSNNRNIEREKLYDHLKSTKKWIPEWEEKMNLKSGGFSIREMKTRWGSCNQRTHKLLFNLELAKKPQPCIEYVVVHELAHIVSKNHDTQFKAVLDKHLPLWEKYKNELNEFII